MPVVRSQNNGYTGDAEIDGLIYKVGGAAFQVSNKLGIGFLERVYEAALSIELDAIGVQHARQVTMRVQYEGQNIGDFKADMVVQDRLLVELKAVDALDLNPFVPQCLNYLRASGLRFGMIINFGTPKISWRVCQSKSKQLADSPPTH